MVAASETRFRGKGSSSGGGAVTRPGERSRVVLEALLVVDAIAFLAASVIHFGYAIPLGFTTLSDVTILPAGMAEGVIGVVFAVAAAAAFADWDWAWNGTLAAYLLGIVGVLIGIGVSVGDSGDSSRSNLLFHLTVLPLLVLGLAVLLTPTGRASLGRKTAAPKVDP